MSKFTETPRWIHFNVSVLNLTTNTTWLPSFTLVAHRPASAKPMCDRINSDGKCISRKLAACPLHVHKRLIQEGKSSQLCNVTVELSMPSIRPTTDISSPFFKTDRRSTHHSPLKRVKTKHFWSKF